VRRRLGLLLALLAAAPALAAERPRTRIQASLSLAPAEIRGTVETRFVNGSGVALDEAVLMLFPNRFARPDEGIDDVNRPFVYPGEDFVPGGIEVEGVEVDGAPAATREIDTPGLLPDWGLRVALPAPLPPGAAATIRARFTTRVPLRFGTFGHFQDTLTAIGGWYPALAALAPDGAWMLRGLPPLADFEVALAAEPPLEILLNGRHAMALAPPEPIAVEGVHFLSLVAAPLWLKQTVDTPAGRVVHYRRPRVRHDRQAFGPDLDEIMRASLAEIVRDRPPEVPPPRGELVVVEAPLRLDLTAPGEGMAVISDRTLDVFFLLRPFHQAQLAEASYAELLRPAIAARESPRDVPWVSEGLSYELARDWYGRSRSDTRSVQDWIEVFNLFAIVDRFEIAPKVPFVAAFFPRATTVDPLRQYISTWTDDRPAGHVVLGKLKQEVGKAEFARLLSACAAAASPLRQCAAGASGRDLDAFFAQWLQPYPEIDYAVGAVEWNEPVATGEDDETRRRTRVTVLRTSSRPIREPVTVRLRSIGGNHVDLRWDEAGDSGEVEARTPFRTWQVVIDPNRELIETTRADNARPPELQVILDTAEVEVSSTEFGLSGLAVARARGDYRKDLAVAGVWNNRGLATTVGPRWHGGEAIDPVFFRHNLYFFYAAQALDSSFRDDRDPDRRTAGHVNGIGLRYDYNNILSYDNPTHEVHLQLHTDWYDDALGSDYDYLAWGGYLVLTHPLFSNRTLLAGQVVNAFTEALGSSEVPNQGLYSLGGSRSIRGIGVEEELGGNIFLLRTELRQMLYPELDLNLLDLLVLRRFQLRPFVDTGRVDDSAGRIYDPSGFAVGVGLGFGLVYDFMGFFPSIAYMEVATRVDRDPGDVQFLFGTRQAF